MTAEQARRAEANGEGHSTGGPDCECGVWPPYLWSSTPHEWYCPLNPIPARPSPLRDADTVRGTSSGKVHVAQGGVPPGGVGTSGVGDLDDRLSGLIVTTLVFAGIAVAAIVILVAAWAMAVQQRVPACQEDQVVVGAGHFDSGRWDSYRCGPSVDDYRSPLQ